MRGLQEREDALRSKRRDAARNRAGANERSARKRAFTSSSVERSIESRPAGPRPVCTSSVTTVRADGNRRRMRSRRST